METIATICDHPRMSKPTKTAMLAAIRRGRGIVRRIPGDKPFAEWWAEHKAAEKVLEERKLCRHPPTAPRARPMKTTQDNQRPALFSAAVGRALRRSAGVAPKTARAHGTPIDLRRDGKIVAEKT